ncbi:MAG TPA: peptidylprolyl isomerase, partial [Burkholderiaceae bacterium]|nr:peptidylprolyl isomerase [Burkholderiaceae bacterium]
AFAQNAAVVNGKAIPTAKVDALVKQVVAQGQQQDTPQLRDMIKKSLIGREVMIQEAEKQGLSKSKDVTAALEQARQDIMLNALAAEYIKKNPVGDAEIKAEYDRAVAAEGDKEYHVRHILVEKEDDAKALIAQIKGGAKFEDIAKKNSKDPGSAQNGGDLDWASPGSYVPEFSQAMVKLTKGQMTDAPVQSQFGWHIIKLDDVRDATFPSLEEVKPQIQQRLTQQKLASFRDDLKNKAKTDYKFGASN